MLEAIFSEGITTVTVTGLTQWDYGRKLTIKGLSYTDNVEVHFSNNIEKEAVVMEVTKSGSDLVTEVPNVLLEKNHDITAWVYIDSGTSGETVRTINLKVKPRIKPADYISENNAGKVIDYVAKAEEYASSAQESAEIAQDNAEKVQANTDLVQDILANVPDFDSYEKLAEHNKLLYDGLYVKGETYSGVASNKGIKLHSVKGKTVQQTTNGYQLFDASKLPTKTIGGATLTNNGDGSFTISGSGNLSANFNYYYYMGGNPLKVGRLTLKLNGPNSIVPLMQVIGLNKLGDGSNQNRVWDIVNEASIDITQKLLEQTKDIYIVFYGGQGKEIKPGTIKPMLYQDGDGTWEQFTGGKPGPNPDGPMPIKNVEIKKINSTAKNIVKSFKILGTTQYVVALEANALFKPNTIYTITLTSKYAGKFYLNESLFTEPTKVNFASPNETKSVTATTLSEVPEIDSVYVIKNAENNTSVEFSNVQIEEGEESTEYVVGNYSKIETSLILAEGDVYENGQVIRKSKRYTVNDVVKSNVQSGTAGSRFLIQSDIGEPHTKVLCTHFKQEKYSSFNIEGDYISTDALNVGKIYIRISQDLTIEEFKQKFPDLMVQIDVNPTTEELKVPTVPSYYPNTNIWTDNTLPTDTQWKILADCDNSLYQEELEKRIEALEHAMLER